MARKTGSLAARAVALIGIGVAFTLAFVTAGVWWMADRVLEDLHAERAAAGGADGMAPTAIESDIVLLKWVLVLGAILILSGAMAFAWLISRRQVISPMRQLSDLADRVGRGEADARAALKTGDELEAFAAAFNRMLDQGQLAQKQLTAMNQALDLKVGELSEANVGLGESNRLKSEFLANVSHELRTPLNSIIGFADLLAELARQEADADPKRLRYIQNIQRSGRNLLDMINELLDMAKIEAGRMEVAIAPASIADLCEGLHAIMRPLAQQKRIDVQVRVAPELPRVETDAGKLQQILYNFLSNAIKFSPDDGVIIVSAAAQEREGQIASVRISVTDHGPGIPADMQDTIFEKFRQVDASHTRRAGGTGLGLAICRELADLLGAAVGVVSEQGRGSTFWVDVPQVHKPKQMRPLMAS